MKMSTPVGHLLLKKGGDIITIAPDDTVYNAVKLMDENAIGSLLILDEDGKQKVRGGDGWQFAVEFSTPLKAFSILAYGQSNNPESYSRPVASNIPYYYTSISCDNANKLSQ